MPALVALLTRALLAGSSAQTSSMLRLPVSSALERCFYLCILLVLPTRIHYPRPIKVCLACGNTVIGNYDIVDSAALPMCCSGVLFLSRRSALSCWRNA